jgi:hypothetical protein
MPDFFTPEQANKMLPEVRPIIQRILQLNRDIPSLRGIKRNEAMDEFNLQISRLYEMGIELKDPNLGLIDFPAKRFDERVYLCWKLGEPEVMFWHDLHSGFKGRKPLKPEPLRAR